MQYAYEAVSERPCHPKIYFFKLNKQELTCLFEITMTKSRTTFGAVMARPYYFLSKTNVTPGQRCIITVATHKILHHSSSLSTLQNSAQTRIYVLHRARVDRYIQLHKMKSLN